LYLRSYDLVGSVTVSLDGEIRCRCSIFSQFPALLASPSSIGPPRTTVATSRRRNRLRRRLPPRPCHHGCHGSSSWLACSNAPLVTPFIVLALLQLRDAHRLHSFTSTTQVTVERRPRHQFSSSSVQPSSASTSLQCTRHHHWPSSSASSSVQPSSASTSR